MQAITVNSRGRQYEVTSLGGYWSLCSKGINLRKKSFRINKILKFLHFPIKIIECDLLKQLSYFKYKQDKCVLQYEKSWNKNRSQFVLWNNKTSFATFLEWFMVDIEWFVPSAVL